MNVAKTANPEGIEIGRRVRELRKRLGLIQEQVAETGGIERVEVSMVEGGKNKVSTERMLNALASGFGLRPDALRGYLDGDLDLDALLSGKMPISTSMREEAVEDLRSLGYKIKRSQHFVEWIENEPPIGAWQGARTVERLVRLASALMDAEDRGAAPQPATPIGSASLHRSAQARQVSGSNATEISAAQKRAIFDDAEKRLQQPRRRRG